MTDAARLVVPSEIPWSQFTGMALEELLFWLCDSMGARELEWRAGSVSGTSRDRGRDLEATFPLVMPDGSIRESRWWFQAKGRRATVSASDVKEAVVEVQSRSDIDVLVIASNSRFSNDTRDWVADFRIAHPRTAIELWDRDHLERTVVKYPEVVARLAPDAMSLQGRLETASETFWSQCRPPTSGQVEEFWEQRHELEFDARTLVAIVVGEAIEDGLVRHPWTAQVDPSTVVAMAVSSLANIGLLMLKGQRNGASPEPLIGAISYLISSVLIRCREDFVLEILTNPWQYLEDPDSVSQASKTYVFDTLINPLVDEWLSRLGAICMCDCERLIGDLRPQREIDPGDRWLALLPTDPNARGDSEPPETGILIERYTVACRAGLDLSESTLCPFSAPSSPPDWRRILSAVRHVSSFRLQQAAARQDSANS